MAAEDSDRALTLVTHRKLAKAPPKRVVLFRLPLKRCRALSRGDLIGIQGVWDLFL